MSVLNVALLVIYVFEILARLYVQRLKFFTFKWNILDVSVVGVDMLSLMLTHMMGDMPSLSVLRIFRAIRLLRAFRVLVAFPELYMLLHGMYSAMKALWCVLVLIIFVAVPK